MPSLWRTAFGHRRLDRPPAGRAASASTRRGRRVAHVEQRRSLPGLDERDGERLAPAAQEHAQPRLEAGGRQRAGADVRGDELERLGLALELELQRLPHPQRVGDELVAGPRRAPARSTGSAGTRWRPAAATPMTTGHPPAHAAATGARRAWPPGEAGAGGGRVASRHPAILAPRARACKRACGNPQWRPRARRATMRRSPEPVPGPAFRPEEETHETQDAHRRGRLGRPHARRRHRASRSSPSSSSSATSSPSTRPRARARTTSRSSPRSAPRAA